MLIDKIKKQTRNTAIKATIKAQQFKSDYDEAWNSQNKNVKKAKHGFILIVVGIAIIILSIFLSLR